LAERKRSFVGRLIVISVFTVFSGYMVAAIFGSVISDLYGSPPPTQATGLSVRERTWCIRSLGSLRDELQGQVTHELLYPVREGDPLARWKLWHAAWVQRLQAARFRCVGTGNGMLDRGYAVLTQMHEGYVSAVEQVTRTRAELAPELKETIQALRQQP
jgi:hypothetical protein